MNRPQDHTLAFIKQHAESSWKQPLLTATILPDDKNLLLTNLPDIFHATVPDKAEQMVKEIHDAAGAERFNV